MNLADGLEYATSHLSSAAIPEPRKEAVSLVSHILNRDSAFLYAHPEYELTADEKDELESKVNRRENHEPFQYIIGRQEFYGLDFEVTPDVLIPRPETEILVEKAIELLRTKEGPRICEVGTGSGCISIALLHELRTASAIAVDISAEAIGVAKRNAIRNEVDQRIEFVLSNIFEQIPAERFDVILSNPPYVPDSDIASLQAEVRDHEPRAALLGGADGLSIIRRIVECAPARLINDGWLLMEIGYNQAEKVRDLFDHQAWARVDLLPDLQGIPRIVVAKHS
jgi:release factor glutamine methyltransferase